jgi:2-polyprenyl-3-methyl-5-hydroxy-6-metoxy-1,4-benzoquinol methylase
MRQDRPEHYSIASYNSKERFCSYWHQIHEIIRLKPKKVIEIGVGNGFVSEYLKKRGINIITLDINKELNPDVVGNILDLPFLKKSFDVVACYEVLEHLPYEDIQRALSEIFRICQSYAILSLPDISRTYRFNLQVPKIGEIKILIPLPRIKKQIHKFDGEHHWEIGKSGYMLDRIINDINEAGFKIEETYRVFEYPYHRFFVLKA